MNKDRVYSNCAFDDDFQTMNVWFKEYLFPAMLVCEEQVHKKLSFPPPLWRQSSLSMEKQEVQIPILYPEKQSSPRSITRTSLQSNKIEDVEMVDDPICDDQLNEEMKLFLEKSSEHQKEMAKVKKRRKEEEDKFVLDTQGPIEMLAPSHLAPSSHPDELRLSDMKHLYGDNSRLILTLETALQSQFDKNLDTLHLQYWPVIPLKLC